MSWLKYYVTHEVGVPTQLMDLALFINMSRHYLKTKLQIKAADEPWITCSGLESVVEEMRGVGLEDVAAITAALEEIIIELSNKAKPGECWATVAPLLPWKKHASIREQLEKRWDNLRLQYSKKVHFITKLSKLAFGSGNDEVHLVDKSRERFFGHIIESSMEYFVKDYLGDESTDLDQNDDMETNDLTIVEGSSKPIRTSTPATFRQAKRKAMENVNVLAKRPNVRDLEEDLDILTRRVEQRWKGDSMVLAKHDEQLDTLKNQKDLDKIVISGVHIELLAGSLEERKPLMFEAVTKVLKSFMDDPPEPTFAIHLNQQFKTTRRVLEVRFGNVERALLVRKTYAKKIQEFRAEKKFPEELNGVRIGMTLTRATRIWIAILRGLANIVNTNTQPNVKAFCMEYQTQPMLKIIIEVGPNQQTSRTFGFTEAIQHVKENFKINDQDFVEAYTLAGNMKQLEQRFVVLKSADTRRRPL